jgi:hypothetical protein
MFQRTWLAVAVSLLCLAPATSRATNITYSIVDQPTYQSGYHITGQIVTDGTIGSLAPSDILSWSYQIKTTGRQSANP